MLSFGAEAGAQQSAATALADLVRHRRVSSLLVERVNGVSVLDPAIDEARTSAQDALTEAGFARTPRGLRLR